MQIGHEVSQRYDVFRANEYRNDIPTGTEEREYPLAVLLHAVTQLEFPAEITIVKLDTTTETTSEPESANKQN